MRLSSVLTLERRIPKLTLQLTTTHLPIIFGGDTIRDTDFGSLYHFPQRAKYGILGDLLAFLKELPSRFSRNSAK